MAREGKGMMAMMFGIPKKRITLYRGLGLPESALKVYRDYAKPDKYGDIKRINFTGYTSTSCEEKKALEFSYNAMLLGQVPVLFVMDTDHYNG